MQIETLATSPAPLTRPGHLLPGTELGPYRVSHVIGSGGMATVYAAVHAVVGKRVAIKVLRAALARSPLMIARFVQEARAVNRIGHPNIVDVFDYGTLDDGSPYFVMELLEGNTLADRARFGAMSVDEVAPIVASVCRALEATHAHGFIHRDIKPANIWVTDTPRGTTTKLLDFGVAKLLDRSAQSFSTTDVGVLIGTPHYMAPEQARGLALTPAADVYALGVVLFELLAGVRPFESRNVADLLVMHLHEEAPPLAKQCQVPTEIARVVDAMLAKLPEDRPSLATVASAFATPTRSLAWSRISTALAVGLLVLELAL